MSKFVFQYEEELIGNGCDCCDPTPYDCFYAEDSAHKLGAIWEVFLYCLEHSGVVISETIEDMDSEQLHNLCLTLGIEIEIETPEGATDIQEWV